ncbi:MAG: hypothetical protein ABW065_03685 [Solirubrobacterales bacterium]
MESRALAGLAKEFGTPCYIYDEALVRRNAARFTRLSYANRAVHFASMANNNPELLRLLHSLGFAVFVNSSKHLKLALACGFAPEEIIYASTGIRRSDLELIAELGVKVNIDSLGQLKAFGEIAPGRSCGIRLNIDENSQGNVFIGMESRIGLLETEIPEALETAAQHNLALVGTHVYLGTNIISLETMMRGVARTLELSDQLADLAYVDLGGGFPVPDSDVSEFDYKEYDRRITTMFEEYSARRGRDVQLILEPGRALFGDAAVFCTSVLEVKDRPDRRLACVDASATLLPRSLFYGEYHAVEVLGRADEPLYNKPTDVVGSTTYSRDFLAKGGKLPAVREGDVLGFRNAGSYGYSMISQFLGQEAPREVLVSPDGAARLIRGGERSGVIELDGFPWTFEEVAPGEAHLHRVLEVVHVEHSGMQSVEVVQTEGYGRGLFLDGRIQHVADDEYVYSEALVHPAMTLMGGRADRVLVIGAGPGGAVREVLGYPGVDEVVQVEIDTAVLDAAHAHLPHSPVAANAADQRYRLVVADALDYLATSDGPFDLVVNDLSEPFEGSPAADLFGADALRLVRSRLRPGGRYVSWAGSVGPKSWDMARRIVAEVASVFEDVSAYILHTQSYGTVWLNVVGSTMPTDPLALSPARIDEQRATTLTAETRFYDGVTHHHMFHLPKDIRAALAQPTRLRGAIGLAVSMRNAA